MKCTLSLLGLPFALGLVAVTASVAQTGTSAAKPRLGVTVRGIVVIEVDPGSVGAKAGIVPGDVMVSWERESLPDTERARELIAAVAPGESVEIGVLRGDETVNCVFVFPAEFDGDGPRLGVTPLVGVRVDHVWPGTVAEQGSLAVGDVLMEWEGQTLDSYDSLIDHLRAVKAGKTQRVTLKRGDRTMEMALAFGPTSSAAADAGESTARGSWVSLPDRQTLLDSFRVLSDLDQVQKEIEEIVALLERAKSDPQRAEAVDRLRGVRGRLSRLAGVVAKAKDTTDKITDIAGHFDVFVEQFADDFGDWKRVRTLAERIMELTAEGKSAEEILATMQKEFEGLPLQPLQPLIRYFRSEGVPIDAAPHVVPGGQLPPPREPAAPTKPGSKAAPKDQQAPAGPPTTTRPTRVRVSETDKD